MKVRAYYMTKCNATPNNSQTAAIKELTMNTHLTLSTMLIASTLLAACSTVPQNARLDEARSQVQTAEGNAQVTNLAPVELKQAKEALATAEQAWTKREKSERVDRLAYLAKRRAMIAEETAKLKVAEQAIATANVDRDKVRLDARTLEADKARQSAKASQAESAEAQRQLEGVQRQSQAMQDQAEQQSAEAKRQMADVQRKSLAVQEQAQQQSVETQRQAQEAQLKHEELHRQAQDADARAHQLDSQHKELNAKKTARGIVVTLGGDVLFDTNMAQLKTGGIRKVEKNAEFLMLLPERNVLVEGFTDCTGSGPVIELLSERGAEAVRSAIVKLVANPSLVRAQGYGEEYPIASNEDAVGRQLNRRVEIVVSDDTGDIAPRNAAETRGEATSQRQ